MPALDGDRGALTDCLDDGTWPVWIRSDVTLRRVTFHWRKNDRSCAVSGLMLARIAVLVQADCLSCRAEYRLEHCWGVLTMSEANSRIWGPVAGRDGSFDPAIPARLAQAAMSALRADWPNYSLPAIALRSLRRCRAIGQAAGYRALVSSLAFQQHVRTEGEGDPLFYLSHPHYLAQGLTAGQRTRAALTHYLAEATFPDNYLDQVYRCGGIVLWRACVTSVTYDIRLMPGNDVAYEGGLSLVLHVDGVRVCVLSYSLVPADLVLSDARASDTIHFITRKQLTPERAYQAAFNTAFDRCTPAHLCFAALAGLMAAQGRNNVAGIAPHKHPSWIPALASQFDTAYADFWRSLAGQKVSAFAYLIDLPMQLTPLAKIEASHRKRTLARRGHIDNVCASAATAIASHLRG